uniref:Uncharacterized protein n=1 Tax=Molossus molossus TaxID=27622 RepID=A0A7J8GR03_MOLMO|nr:hypothetical protein HJG59_011277 [Molossus molossus]
MNSVGLRLGPGVSPPSQNQYSISKPWACRYPLLGSCPKDGGFVSATLTAVYFTGPLESGSRRDCAHHRDVTVLPPFLLLALERCCRRGRDRAVYLSLSSVLWAGASSPGFQESTPFREGETPPEQHSLKLAMVTD